MQWNCLQRKITGILIFAVTALILQACSSFAGISPAGLREACAEYDSERYDDVQDLRRSLDNPRALPAGMYMTEAGDGVSSLLQDNKLNDRFDLPGMLPPEKLYSSDISEITLLIQGDEEDGSLSMLAVAAAAFDSTSDAEDFYVSIKNKITGKLNADGMVYGDLAEHENGGIRSVPLVATRNRRASVNCVYIAGKNVLVLLGCEYKTNSLKDNVDTLCSLLKIDPPDLASVDCTVPSQGGDRLLNLCEETGAAEARTEDYDRTDFTVPVFFHSDSDLLKDYSMLIEDDTKLYTHILDTIILYDHSGDRDDRYDNFVAVEFLFDSVENAGKFYEYICGKQDGSMSSDVIMSRDNGENNGIAHHRFKCALAGFYAEYSMFAEGSRFYYVLVINSTEEGMNDTSSKVLGTMGLSVQ